MRGRMAYHPERRSGKHRKASTARTIYLPARRTQRQLQRIDDRITDGEVVIWHDDRAVRLSYMPPETEEQRADVVEQLRERIAAAGDAEVRELLAAEVERVTVSPLANVPEELEP